MVYFQGWKGCSGRTEVYGPNASAGANVKHILDVITNRRQMQFVVKGQEK